MHNGACFDRSSTIQKKTFNNSWRRVRQLSILMIITIIEAITMASGFPSPPRDREGEEEEERYTKERKEIFRKEGVWSMAAETSPFLLALPPRACITDRARREEDRRIEMTKAVARRARRRRARQVALNWKRPKLEFSCQSWASWPPGVVSKPIAFWLYLPPPPPPPLHLLSLVGAGFVVGTDKFVDVYTEITRVTSAGERSWEFVGVASEPIDCWKFDHLADWFDLKLEYETRTLEMTMLNLKEEWNWNIYINLFFEDLWYERKLTSCELE